MGPNTKVKDKQCEGTTTQQLLADLTDDFEEAITAQICLSNQLLDANLETVESVKEDILILKSENSGVEHNSLSMEVNSKTSETSSTASATQKQQGYTDSASDDKTSSVAVEIKSEQTENEADDATELASYEELPQKEAVADNSFKESGFAESPSGSKPTPIFCKPDISRPTILAVEELPPIHTDSTMTASEVEDNIEERLSQLDGSPIVNPRTTEESEVVSSIVDAITAERCPSPAMAPSRVDELQQQQQHHLQQTPPPPIHTQPNSFTPQSSSSSVNTMGSSSLHLPKDFMKDASAGELEDQDIEEVLKALKGLDSSAGADTICDLNVLFNEVYTTLNYEEINSQHNSSGCGSKPVNPLKEVQAEIEKKQQTMQRKIEFLQRRMRKMQARFMCKHASEEISGLFEWSARIASKNCKLSHEDDVTERQQLNTAEQKLHPVTAAQLSTMLRKIEVVANAQQLTMTTTPTSVNNVTKRKNAKKIATTDNLTQPNTAAGSSEPKINIITVVPTFEKSITDEIGHVSGMLQSEMHEIQQAMDSDATESSSGGESADEMVTYNNQLQQSLKITKRAAWRYSRDRAAIASRWSWLLSQISDLEIKIRQHSELHQELLRTKGSTIVESDVLSTTAITNIPNISPYNGYKAIEPLPVMDNAKDSNGSGAVDEESSCCRTRGMLASNFRKRKLFQTENIHTFSKKAARPSTIKCGCQWPLLPCTLCTGRADPTAPRDLPDTMMMADRVALLDPGYHPVLSFPTDVSNSIHFEAICRMPEWQQRVLRCPIKNIAKNFWRAERDAMHASTGKKNHDPSVKRKYIKKKDRFRMQQEQEQQQMQANNGNGIGTLSISSTPLVANKLRKNHDMTMKTLPSQKIYNHYNNNISSNNNNNIYNSNNNQYQNHHLQTNDYHQPNYVQYNHSLAHSSSISSTIRNSKNRKTSSSATASNSTFLYNHLHSNDFNYSNSELNYLHSDSWDSQVTRSRNSSPTNSGSKKNKSLDRRNRTSYDIDNIVIPYSVAAATRVELLPYKEIPTPKWRVIEEDSNVLATFSRSFNSSPQNNMVEFKAVNCNVDRNVVSNGKTELSSHLPEMQPAKFNNIAASSMNNCSETVDIKSPNVNALQDADSSLGTKCSSATTRYLSEKENSTDTIDAFDTVEISTKKAEERDIAEISDRTKANAEKPISAEDEKQFEKEESECNNSNAFSECCIGIEELVDGFEEDITDETMILRHERALIEERKRLKYPWSTRSRANRRIDSRVDWSSGANTPDPLSPATHTLSGGGGDLDSIPSPLAPLTPLNPLDTTAEFSDTVLNNSSIALPPPPATQSCNSKRSERRRTTSSKNNKEQERRSSSPDPKDLFPPYEPRKFPISNEVFENMLKIDNIVNSLSSPKSKNAECNSKNESIIAKKNNHKNNVINSSVTMLNNREFGSEHDDSSEVGLNEIDGFLHPNIILSTEDDYQLGYEVSSHLISNDISDGDTSDAEGFSDDDPNDPEWKGETEDKEKNRRNAK